MADDVTLRECPFCGAPAEVYAPYGVIRCSNPDCLMEVRTMVNLREERRTEVWNNRVPDPRIAALEAELAELKERRCETCIHGEPTVRRGYKTIYCPRHDTYVWDGCDFGCIYWQGEET